MIDGVADLERHSRIGAVHRTRRSKHEVLDRVLAAVQRWAGEDLRSLNGQIEYILRQALAKRGVKLNEEPAPPPDGPPDADASPAAG